VDALLGALMDARTVDDDVCVLSFRLTSPG
jgi:hypothetical protein